MTTVQIKDIKKGELFRLVGKNAVWVKGDFERSLKKYSALDYNDFNKERFLKGTTLVEIDFIY